jgi:hypothetical protein
VRQLMLDALMTLAGVVHMVDKKAHLAFAEYLRDQAEWRLEKYLEYGDRRNLTSAVGLEELAVFIMSLPSDEVRLARLDSLLRLGQFGFPWFWSRDDGRRPAASESPEELIATFRFHDSEQECDSFLSQLVQATEMEAEELVESLAPALGRTLLAEGA